MAPYRIIDALWEGWLGPGRERDRRPRGRRTGSPAGEGGWHYALYGADTGTAGGARPVRRRKIGVQPVLAAGSASAKNKRRPRAAGLSAAPAAEGRGGANYAPGAVGGWPVKPPATSWAEVMLPDTAPKRWPPAGTCSGNVRRPAHSLPGACGPAAGPCVPGLDLRARQAGLPGRVRLSVHKPIIHGAFPAPGAAPAVFLRPQPFTTHHRPAGLPRFSASLRPACPPGQSREILIFASFVPQNSAGSLRRLSVRPSGTGHRGAMGWGYVFSTGGGAA